MSQDILTGRDIFYMYEAAYYFIHGYFYQLPPPIDTPPTEPVSDFILSYNSTPQLITISLQKSIANNVFAFIYTSHAQSQGTSVAHSYKLIAIQLLDNNINLDLTPCYLVNGYSYLTANSVVFIKVKYVNGNYGISGSAKIKNFYT